MSKLNENESVGRFDFELCDQGPDDKFYQCRGERMYDDEHDEIPEPALWSACDKLIARLKERGVKASKEHSEKGWVEVNINV